MIAASCAAIGLPPPEHVEVSGFSGVTGVPPSKRFIMVRERGEAPQHRYIAHVRLRFAKSVHGPVVLGAGRHFGLGLCLPLQDGHDADVREGSRS